MRDQARRGIGAYTAIIVGKAGDSIQCAVRTEDEGVAEGSEGQQAVVKLDLQGAVVLRDVFFLAH